MGQAGPCLLSPLIHFLYSRQSLFVSLKHLPFTVTSSLSLLPQRFNLVSLFFEPSALCCNSLSLSPSLLSRRTRFHSLVFFLPILSPSLHLQLFCYSLSVKLLPRPEPLDTEQHAVSGWSNSVLLLHSLPARSTCNFTNVPCPYAVAGSQRAPSCEAFYVFFPFFLFFFSNAKGEKLFSILFTFFIFNRDYILGKNIHYSYVTSLYVYFYFTCLSLGKK